MKYSLLLMDKGYSREECKQQVIRLNKQFQKPLSEYEIESTIFKTIDRREENVVVEDYEDDYEEDVFAKIDK